MFFDRFLPESRSQEALQLTLVYQKTIPPLVGLQLASGTPTGRGGRLTVDDEIMQEKPEDFSLPILCGSTPPFDKP